MTIASTHASGGVLVLTVDTAGFRDLAHRTGNISRNIKPAIGRALNRTGAMARTAIVRALRSQTGLPYRAVRRALRSRTAHAGNLVFSITATGRDLSLKYFSPRETRRGVVARLPQGPKLFPGTFLKGGKFPRRKTVAKFRGHAFRRTGAGRTPIAKVMSGLSIPAQMVTGQSREAFFATSRDVLPRRIAHEIGRLATAAGR